jgi:hypothetical protein
MIAYKLFRVKKNSKITSLFMNKKRELPIGEWINSRSYPTKGFAVRPGWHSVARPKADHLSKIGRKWYKVEIENFRIEERSVHQGSKWYVSKRLKIIKELI